MDMRDGPLVRRVVFLGKALSAQFHADLAEHGCTVPTWAVLNNAHHFPGLSQADLAAEIGIEGPTLVRHLDRLSEEGLVDRVRDPNDRRIARVQLTALGEQRWAEIRHVAEAHEARMTRHLSATQRKTLEAAIASIYRALEEPDDPDRS